MWRMLLSNVFVEQIVPLLPSFKCPSMDERSLISRSFLRKREWTRCRWRRRGFSLCSSIVLLSHFLSLTSFVSVSLFVTFVLILHFLFFFIFLRFHCGLRTTKVMTLSFRIANDVLKRKQRKSQFACSFAKWRILSLIHSVIQFAMLLFVIQ